MLLCLEIKRSVRCLCFPLEKTTFELSFIKIETSYFSAIRAHFTHCVVRSRLDTRPKRKYTLRSVNLLRELFQVVDRTVTKSEYFVSRILRVRSLVFVHAPICLEVFVH